MGQLGITTMAHDLAAHAAARQGLIARNVANADTPGYRARDLPSFQGALDGGMAMRATRPGHMQGGRDAVQAAAEERGGETSPNGNDVSIEMEMMQAASTKQSHEMAISVYSTVRGIMSASLGAKR